MGNGLRVWVTQNEDHNHDSDRKHISDFSRREVIEKPKQEMKKKSFSQSPFFNVRVLIRLFIILAGIFLALLGLGRLSNALAQPKISARDSAGLFSVPTFSAQSGYDVSRFTLPTTDGGSALDGFDPNANGPVYVVVVQPDGKILIGGGFTTLSPNGGPTVTRNHIARLNPDGTLDNDFNPNANDLVRSIAVQADGKILAGGAFNGENSIGGQMRNRIARLDPVSGLADSFDPNATGFENNTVVASIVVQADDKILVGGFFLSIGGQPRNSIARLDPTTGLADSFDPHPGDPLSFPAFRAIAVQADGKILVSGVFNVIGGQPRNGMARLDPTTGLADLFDPNPNDLVRSIAVQADGKILAGGLFTSIGGQPRNHIARLDATTGLADSFDPNANDVVRSIAVQADGKILAGGDFTMLSPNGGATVTRNRIARLETDGRLDQTLNLSTVGSYVTATAVQADGKILVGGEFSTVLGVTRNNIARLNTDGTLDIAFNPNADFAVHSIALQADGKILAGGFFFTIGGQTRNHIARLDPITGLADLFDPNANSTVYALAVQSDGKILAAGDFTSIGGQTRNHIARLNPDGTLDNAFNPNANDRIYSITVQTDGKILASGLFTTLSPNGGPPVTRNHIARLNPDGTLDNAFDPNANGNVHSFAVQTDGKIVAGGMFSSVGGQTRSLFARLTNDTAALQNLAVTQTTITWTLGGSSVQFTRVPLEYSADNVTYTSLGNGTATGNNWILTGLNLPTGQNIYIRARGYYRCGFSNGSESTMESVRNAFLSGGPSPTPSATPTATPSATARPSPMARSRPTPAPRP
jgi:uncharacterized delta-60 repeat protein